MPSPVWHLEDHVARLDTARWSAAIDLARPSEGFVHVRAGGQSLPSMRLHAITFPGPPQAPGDVLCDEYVRGCDLVAAYRQSPDWPVYVDVTRRAAGLGEAAASEALQMLVSVRTSELQCWPALSAETHVPADEVLWLVNPSGARFTALSPEPDAPCSVRPNGGPGCLLFRLPDGDLTYAEMVHPSEFYGSELVAPSQPGGAFTLRHALFACPLEKGVILRARLCSVFVPRDGDQQAAAACYTGFLDAPLPLGT